MNVLQKVCIYTSSPMTMIRVAAQSCTLRWYSSTGKEAKFPKNVIEHLSTSQEQPTNGIIYDKKPFRMELEEGNEDKLRRPLFN
ncbi:AGAP004885-PA-like protein [Anopheles sinensis]|uniref:AGAP004885-PA-like protein n=1 Tax=Anopheles sinensis TaxID=74873 RepID=A0A084VXI3_ANOSI|nr:AGAP004885-PA-like protein [Anopheles sinensis]